MDDIPINDAGTQDLKDNMDSLVRVFCGHLQQLWKNMGFEIQVQQRRGQMVYRHLRTLMNDLLVEEKNFLKRMIDSINSSKAKILQLSEELFLPPFQVDQDLPLIELDKILKVKVNQLQAEKRMQFERLQRLQIVEQNLCVELSMQPYPLIALQPIAQQLADLNHQVNMLHREKENRLARINRLKQNAVDLMAETEYSPTTPFGRAVFFADDIVPTHETITRMNKMLEQLETRRREMKRIADALRGKLTNLWQLLEVEPERRQVFLQEHSDSKPSTIQVLLREVDRCENLKRRNMVHVIEKTRNELREWWTKCHASEEQRLQFEAFRSANFCEELYDVHQSEVQRWKNHYQKWSKLFNGIEKLKILWQNVKEFETQSKDPKRFNNRKGFLLQEEKARKKLNRDLNETEDAVQTLASQYQQQEKRSIIVEGKNLAELVTQYREAHVREKARTRKPSLR